MSLKTVFNLAHFVYLFGFLAGALVLAGWTLVKAGGWNVLFGMAFLLGGFTITFKLDLFLKLIGVKEE